MSADAEPPEMDALTLPCDDSVDVLEIPGGDPSSRMPARGLSESVLLQSPSPGRRPSRHSTGEVLPPAAVLRRRPGRKDSATITALVGRLAATIDEDGSFTAQDSENNILFDDTAMSGLQRRTVRAATLPKLVERLTYHLHADQEFVHAFFLTYRSFAAPNEVLDLLQFRFHSDRSPMIHAGDWPRVLKTVRLRVVNVLRHWVTYHRDDFASVEMQQSFNKFVDEDIEKDAGLKQASDHLRASMTSVNNKVSKGAPPVGAATVDFMECDPAVVAQQLTLVEADLFLAIKPPELLQTAWSKADKVERAPHVTALIQRFNVVSIHVAWQILKMESLKARSEALRRFIAMGNMCNELRNYNTLLEIIAGLRLSPVQRLKQTWALLSSQDQETYKELCAIVARGTGNYRSLRDRLNKTAPSCSCLPYLGMFLTDLTFIEDGNSDFVSSAISLVVVILGRTSPSPAEVEQHRLALEFEGSDLVSACIDAVCAKAGLERTDDMCLHIPPLPSKPGDPGLYLSDKKQLNAYGLRDGSYVLLKSKTIKRSVVIEKIGTLRAKVTVSTNVTLPVGKMIAECLPQIRLKVQMPDHSPDAFILRSEEGDFLVPDKALWEQGISDRQRVVLSYRLAALKDVRKDDVDPRLVQLMHQQCRDAIMSGDWPVPKRVVPDLAALDVAQRIEGEPTDEEIKECLPEEARRDCNKKMARTIKEKVEKWRGLTKEETRLEYVTTVAALPTYGGKFFSCKEKGRVKVKASRIAGVTRDCLVVLNPASLEVQRPPLTLSRLREVKRDGNVVRSWFVDAPEDHEAKGEEEDAEREEEKWKVTLHFGDNEDATAFEELITRRAELFSIQEATEADGDDESKISGESRYDQGGVVSDTKKESDEKGNKVIHLINFEKWRHTAAIMMRIQDFQRIPFDIEALPDVQRLFSDPVVPTEDELHDLSLLREPRDAKK